MRREESDLYGLFEQACALDGAAREQLLAEVAARDAALAAELASLLAADEGTGRVPRMASEESPFQAAGTPPPAAGFDAARLEAQLAELAAHSRGGSRYEIGEELGRGAMGRVRRVVDIPLGRELAMKTIRSDGGSDEDAALLLARFLNEARILGKLSHPGIVSIHELGLDAEGRAYFTMPIVQGGDLRDAFAKARAGQDGWSLARAIGVLQRVCEAMAFAHANGVVHRDLKPSNVMVGRFGEIQVMDWGVASARGEFDARDLRPRPRRAEDDGTSGSPVRTMDGAIIGTPFFMSPEQALGRSALVDERSDVYAVGAMLYELLADRRPYEEPGKESSPYAVLARLLEREPAPLRSIAPDAPAELVAISEKAMARDPSARYATMEALADELRAFLEGRVVRAFRTGAWVELTKWVQRNQAFSGALAATFLAVALGAAGFAFKAREASDAARTAQRAYQRTLEEMVRADREAEAATRGRDDVLRLSALQRLDDLVAESDRLWPAHQENLKKYEDWLQSAEALVAELPDHERKLSELRSKAVPWTEEEQAKPVAGHPKSAELESAKRHREHLEKLRAALESSEPPRDPTPAEVGLELASLPASANEVNGLARPLIDPDRADWGGEAKGLVLARRAVELAAGLDPAEHAGLRDTLAWALYANGRFDEAVAEEEQALEEAGADEEEEFEGYLERLKGKIEEEIDPEKDAARAKHLAELEQRIAALEAEVSKRPEWLFADAKDKWWHNQLEKLVSGLKAFSDPETGLASSGTSADHGWGVRKRLEFAQTIAERSVSNADAAARWAAAIASIASASECPLYGRLRITPQLGLLPIGRDPDSGLWEFAHLQTGEPAGRESDGRLALKESMGLVFVLLPGGTFQMGAQASDPTDANYDPGAIGDEGPVHNVTLSPFFLSKFEMTQGQWKTFSGSNPSYYVAGWSSAKTARITLVHPVEQVSWETCEIELGRMGLRLPSEAQWEFACRAGTRTPWSTGDTLASLRGFANIADEGSEDAYRDGWMFERGFVDGWDVHCPISSLRPNAFGLHEMHGNVMEWCLDGYEPDFYGEEARKDPVSDPSGSASRVIRGGSYYIRAVAARSAGRFDNPPSNGDVFLGLRPARALLAP